MKRLTVPLKIKSGLFCSGVGVHFFVEAAGLSVRCAVTRQAFTEKGHISGGARDEMLREIFLAHEQIVLDAVARKIDGRACEPDGSIYVGRGDLGKA